MPKKSSWSCELIKSRGHEINDNDFKNLLAEFWEILLDGPCQQKFQLPRVQNDLQGLNRSARLSQLMKRTRR